ncbi:ECF-type sigma factor [Acidithiobacillus ferrooxidans]|uniref:ECF-type sigma factor n=2 Tax=Acidithiobacillus ferrooxidans TaxID=920 RepID=UPI00352DBD60
MMMRSSQLGRLDEADRWLLQNDPHLSKTSPRALASRRIRQQHAQGLALLDDAVPAEAPQQLMEEDQTAERLVRLAPPAIRKLVALRLEFPSASQAELARMLGCSRQAVHKKRQRLIAYLRAMAAPPVPPTPGSGPTMPVFMRPNGQFAWDFEDQSAPLCKKPGKEPGHHKHYLTVRFQDSAGGALVSTHT